MYLACATTEKLAAGQRNFFKQLLLQACKVVCACLYKQGCIAASKYNKTPSVLEVLIKKEGKKTLDMQQNN